MHEFGLVFGAKRCILLVHPSTPCLLFLFGLLFIWAYPEQKGSSSLETLYTV